MFLCMASLLLRQFRCPTGHGIRLIFTEIGGSRVLHYINCCNYVSGFGSAVLDLFEKLRSHCPTHSVLVELVESLVRGAWSGNGKAKQKETIFSCITLPYHLSLRRVNALLADTTRPKGPHPTQNVQKPMKTQKR